MRSGLPPAIAEAVQFVVAAPPDAVLDGFARIGTLEEAGEGAEILLCRRDGSVSAQQARGFDHF